MWKVYKRTCPNGLVYIGITSRTLEDRMGNGYQNNRQFALDIIKYGKENIISEVLEEYPDYDTALERELYYIHQYKDICYNKVGKRKDILHKGSCTMIGTDHAAQNNMHNNISTERSPQRKQHIIPLTEKPMHRRICPISVYDLTGKYLTTYESASIASNQTGVNTGDIISCCKGVKADGKSKYQCKGLIFRYAVDKLDEFPDKPVACKKVDQYTLDGEYIKTFDSLKEAWLHTGATIGSIGHVCKGLQKTAGGYIWKYAEQEKEVG